VGFVEQVTPNGVRPNLDGEYLADKVSKLENEVSFWFWVPFIFLPFVLFQRFL
jgi:hypothetical protein